MLLSSAPEDGAAACYQMAKPGDIDEAGLRTIDTSLREQPEEPGVMHVKVGQSWSKKQLRSRILKLLR